MFDRLDMPVLDYQLVEGNVCDFATLAGGSHLWQQFLPASHHPLRVVFVDVDVTWPRRSGSAQDGVAVLEGCEFDDDRAVAMLRSGARAVSPFDGHRSHLLRRQLQLFLERPPHCLLGVRPRLSRPLSHPVHS